MMISLTGLTLVTGRSIEARWILRTSLTMYATTDPEPVSRRTNHVASITPPMRRSGSFPCCTAVRALPGQRDLGAPSADLKDIVRHHLEGTRFGIKVDPSDGLVTQGEEGYALTWMDAKVGYCTPRRGSSIEINALWYNALRLLADWLREVHDPEAEEIAGSSCPFHVSSIAAFGTPSAAISTMSLTAK